MVSVSAATGGLLDTASVRVIEALQALVLGWLSSLG
jgi:hypothetical protein